MIFPGIQAHSVEVLLALLAILKILSVFIHLSEANRAVSVILEIYVLGVLLACRHSAL